MCYTTTDKRCLIADEDIPVFKIMERRYWPLARPIKGWLLKLGIKCYDLLSPFTESPAPKDLYFRRPEFVESIFAALGSGTIKNPTAEKSIDGVTTTYNVHIGFHSIANISEANMMYAALLDSRHIKCPAYVLYEGYIPKGANYMSND